MKHPHRAPATPALKTTANMVVLVLASLLATSQTVQAQTRSSALYYQMGGSSPGGLGNFKSTIPIQIGLAADLRLNYSCGKFPLRQTSCRLPFHADDPRQSDTTCKRINIRQSS
jgi:hypothetical protein